ncbi:MAG: hypothetical protein IPH69_01845 [Bacteroidales bacterium]|nr:hypothetical protein [Bacteroidales bacterium]
MINHSFLIGISGGVNLGHPRVNYWDTSEEWQHISNPGEVVHYGGQMLLAYGTTKDYENPKRGLLDNFWNISGAPFFVMEPGLNIEANLSRRVTLVCRECYGCVSGAGENNGNVRITQVRNERVSAD